MGVTQCKIIPAGGLRPSPAFAHAAPTEDGRSVTVTFSVPEGDSRHVFLMENADAVLFARSIIAAAEERLVARGAYEPSLKILRPSCRKGE